MKERLILALGWGGHWRKLPEGNAIFYWAIYVNKYLLSAIMGTEDAAVTKKDESSTSCGFHAESREPDLTCPCLTFYLHVSPSLGVTSHFRFSHMVTIPYRISVLRSLLHPWMRSCCSLSWTRPSLPPSVLTSGCLLYLLQEAHLERLLLSPPAWIRPLPSVFSQSLWSP